MVRRTPALSLVLILLSSMVLSGLLGQPWAESATQGKSSRTAAVQQGSSRDAQVCPEQSILPAYFYPGASWQAALASATSSSTIGVSPDSGPGSSFDSNYEVVVSAARSRGVQLLGYINTNYGALPIATVDQEISEYQIWYGITDIYLDDSSSSATDLAYYQQATAAVRATNADAVVMLNPGTYPDQSYMSLGDLINVFEQPYSAFVNDPPPQWVYDYP